MGTRHLTVVIQQETPKVAQYGQWDGYPSGQGITILNFLSHHNSDDFKQFRKNVERCKYADPEYLTKLWKECGADDSGWVTSDISSEFKRRYPKIYASTTRDTGAEILKLIHDGEADLLVNSYEFAKDSLFCEYAYVIDLDKNVFEIYEGFNKSPLDEDERFYDKICNEQAYKPVRFLTSYPLDNLPTPEEFLKELEPNEDD